MNTRLLVSAAAFAFGFTQLSAQTTDTARLTKPGLPEKPATTATTEDGELSLEDLRDMGPVQVLAKAPTHKWFEAGADMRTYFTDNAALLEQKTASDVNVLSAHVGVNAKPIRTDAGAVTFRGEYEYSALFYGALSGRTNHDIENSVRKVDQLDFQTHSAKAEAEWNNKGWSVKTGGRFAAYFNTETNAREYQDFSPYISVGHRFLLSQEDILDLSADADYRFSNTPLPAIASSLGTDMNDRADAGITAAYTRLIGDTCFAQAAYRYSIAQYTLGGSTLDAGAGRTDHTHLVIFSAGYAPTSWLVTRVYTSWEARDSNESVVSDYRVFNAGLGASLTARF